MIDDDQLADLAKLAINRCRKASMSVGQLLDDEGQRASVLLAVAIDLIRGAASTLEDTEDHPTPELALKAATAHVLEGLGVVEMVTGKKSLFGRRR